MALKWGIASAGKICNDFVVAVKALPPEDHQIVAVAARSLTSAEKFATTHGIPRAYEGYKKLAEDANVDVVYVGVLNPQHYEVSKMMLENGKHVLCEKPFTMNEKQTRKLIEIARAKKLFVMEAIWSRFFPAYRELGRIIEAGDIGEVIQVTVDFGVPIAKNDRIKLKELGGGVILDLGIYVLQFQQYVFRGLSPTKIVATGHLNEQEVDNSASAIITYSGNKTALVSVSSLVKLACQGTVCGTKGMITIDQMWCPTSFTVNGKVKNFPLIENDGSFNYNNSAGLAYEAEEVWKCIKEGKIESEQLTHEETIQLAGLMDFMRREIGVVFPADAESY
ncbi:hypothetical protein NQ315_007793 [Exocentrus adspersus]|uniref:Trans-1,2-dihydrobenzene-1,2-diol dehydrogenase n=1 Tax=Exocentrus adspersus TaxID=1586481 RepID=A0AAV8W8Y5_9CUCU|nr:hypothetical protein NQ315_007793 [Exocentrus adspersus]